MTKPQTEITIENLLAAGYREFTPNEAIDKFNRGFQKRITANGDTKYFISVRYWRFPDHETFDAQVCCDTDTAGYAWATLKENTIDGIESRAEAIWKAAGAVMYD
jgi:hypothetical protein